MRPGIDQKESESNHVFEVEGNEEVISLSSTESFIPMDGAFDEGQ